MLSKYLFLSQSLKAFKNRLHGHLLMLQEREAEYQMGNNTVHCLPAVRI